MNNHETRYTSRITTIFTLIGVAVGLGNVWRFPYMMGSYGGSAFLAVYLLFTFLFAIPALMAEMSLGKASRSGILGAFSFVFGDRGGKLAGYLLLLTVFIAGSYYSVVLANVFYTTWFSMFEGFRAENLSQYDSGLNNSPVQLGITTLLISAALLIIHRGLRGGIEKVSKIAIPFFLISILYLIFYALSLPGATDRLAEFLKPDLSVLTPSEIFAALGQAFFSVGLGGTFMVVYGSYLREEESIPRIAVATCLGNAGASLLVSLFLVPTILVFGLSIESGPRLIFNTLPVLFSRIPFGRFAGSLFLLALCVVAFLSLVAAYQVVVSSLNKEIFKNIGRGKIIVGFGLMQAVLTIPSNLYPPLIGKLDLIFGSGMQVFGSALAILGVTWGLGRTGAIQGIFGEGESTAIGKLTYYWLRWAVPAVLFAVLIGYIATSAG